MSQPVDGFTVESDPHSEDVTLILSNRNGDRDRYVFQPIDAVRIGQALVGHAVSALLERPHP